MFTVAIVYHSQSGQTEAQAEAVRRGVETVEDAIVLYLTADEATSRLEDLDDVDAIIFGSPTYMGSMSAGMKVFLESAVDRWTSRAWQDKVAGAFTTSLNFSGDKLNTLVGLAINAMQQGMIFVSLGVLPGSNERNAFATLEGPSSAALNRVDSAMGAMSTTFEAGELIAPGDAETAEIYGRRVAEITAQFVRGRRMQNEMVGATQGS